MPFFEGQDIHLSDFPEKHPKNADLFFSSENAGSRQGSRVVNEIFFYGCKVFCGERTYLHAAAD